MNGISVNIRKYYLSMHYVTIAVLLIVAFVDNIGRGFPVNMGVAVLSSSLLDVLIKRLWLKKELTMPLSAIITGLIIGAVTPFKAPTLAVIIPSAIAISSKFLIRVKGRHIFNPAVFGVVTTILMFGSIAPHGAPEAAAHASNYASIGGYTVALPLVPLLLFASYRARKLWISLPFLIVTALLFQVTGLAQITALNMADINTFLDALPYYFAFIIASEPKTTPYPRREQIFCGVGLAVVSAILSLHTGSHISALVSLLLGNLIYSVYRAGKN